MKDLEYYDQIFWKVMGIMLAFVSTLIALVANTHESAYVLAAFLLALVFSGFVQNARLTMGKLMLAGIGIVVCGIIVLTTHRIGIPIRSDAVTVVYWLLTGCIWRYC